MLDWLLLSCLLSRGFGFELLLKESGFWNFSTTRLNFFVFPLLSLLMYERKFSNFKKKLLDNNVCLRNHSTHVHPQEQWLVTENKNDLIVFLDCYSGHVAMSFHCNCDQCWALALEMLLRLHQISAYFRNLKPKNKVKSQSKNQGTFLEFS